MCMTANDYETKKFVKRNKSKKEITVWKVYRVRQNIVNPCWMAGDAVKQGRIKSDRERRHNDYMDESFQDGYVRGIFRGIHVFLTRQGAREYAYHGENVFKCKAQMSDLVAIGGVDVGSYDRAVFMNIHITKEEFLRGKKGRN